MTSSRVRLRRIKDPTDRGLLGNTSDVYKEKLANKDVDHLGVRPNSEQKKSFISRNIGD